MDEGIQGELTVSDDLYLGWGMIGGGVGSLVAWMILASLGHAVNPGIIFGPMIVGAWKVFSAKQ